ncbi:uncharacterized protein LOC143210537 [Lasioglossum baleicum]|uniref:uncharacterized protein LOC143210537 n=1 Tax=Lasioglossum baleicum TaxID=434251 RepID=UPI003FCE59A3
MMEEVLVIADSLSELIQNMQKNLQCIICLHTITNAIRTRCGHRFCRECIQKVLQSKNAACPLCNSFIHRRNIRDDEHMEIYINRLEKLIEAIQKDVSIDVSTHVSRPRSTRESCSSDNTDTAKPEQEDYNQPGCSYAQPKPMKPASSQAKRASSKSRRSENGKTKKDTFSDASSITKFFPKQALSPSYSDENSSELKIQSWLETLPDNMDFYKSNLIKPPKTNPNNTLVHSISQNKVSAIEHEPEHIATVRDNNNSKDVSSRDQKDEDGRKRMIKARESRRSSSTLTSRTNEVSGRMQTNRVDQRRSTSSTGEDVVQDHSEDIHKTSPCDLLPSTKKNWTSVVQFGKEMRSRKKIRSLNVSIGNKNKKSTDESVKEPAPKQKELPRRSTRRSAERPSVAGNDANEKSPVNKYRREQQPGDKNSGSMTAGESSFVELEQGEQVRIRNLNSYQMNDIIGVEDGQRELEIENRPLNDNDAERQFLQELDLCWTPRKGTKSSSIDVTPARRSRENLDSPNLLYGYVSPSEEQETVITSEPRPAALLQSSTPLPNRLSLKRRDIDSTLDDPAAAGADSRLLAVKRDLNREIGGNAERCAIETKSTETGEKPDRNNGVENGHVRDAGTANKPESERPENKRQEKSLVMFKKLGKVVKYRRRPCRFLYLGSTIRRSFGIQDRVERLQRLCNPAKLENPPKLMSENSFGNNTRVTANDAVSQGEGNLAAGREDAAVTARETSEKLHPVSKVLELRSESSNSTVASPHIPRAPKLNIESYDTLSKDIVSATVASELRDSNDILFVSIYETEENGTVPVHQRLPPDNTTLERTIKMLSPKNDSQLKFLSLESPTTDTQPATKQQGEDDIVVKRSNLSDTRSVHSTDLVRTLRQGSEGSGADATSRKKRKRSASRDNLVERTKWTTDDNDQEENSCNSFSSKGATYTKDDRTKRKHDVKTNCPVDQSTRHMEIVSLSSDSDAENKEDASKEQKMVYKRIVPLATSSSSSSKKNNTSSSDKKETELATKRKRSISPDSNSYRDVDLILNSWSKDLKPTDRFSRRGETEGRVPAVSANKPDRRSTDNASAKSSLTDSSVMHKRTAPFKRRCLFLSDTDSNSVKSNAAMIRNSSNRGSFDENDSSDFGKVIDTIRDIQRERLATPVSDKEPAKHQSKQDASLMHDNFDEIMANVDTEKLICDYRAGPNSDSSGVGVGRLRAPNKDPSVSLHKGSDKENDYKESGRLYDSESETENDKTLSPEHVNATDKSSTITDDRSRYEAKPVEPTIRNNVTNRLSTINAVYQGSDKKIEDIVNDVTLKEICFDQDSLMNITQHQMQIKQFEDDLFGRTADPARKHENEQRMPQETKNEGDRCSDSRRQDAEHSGEEDDIVENTPNVKVKNMSMLSSSEKRSSTESSTVRMNRDRVGSTPSSTSERSTEPLYQRRANPMYQSTPKVQAKADCMGVANTAEKRLKAASRSEPMNRPVNEVARISDQRLARQRLCFVCSGLTATEIKQVKRLASLVNAGYVNQFDPDVTHVIVKVNEETNGASKTLKYLQGIAHRKWIVGYQWVIGSLRENKLINEERYEVVDVRSFEAGPRNSRLRQKDLFEGFAFLCIGPYENVSVEQYEELLRATGGTVVDSLDALTVAKTRMRIIVIHADIHEYEIIGWYKKARAVPIIHDWIVECISRYKLISFYPYLQELLRADVLALGFPKFLVEDDEDEDSMARLGPK